MKKLIYTFFLAFIYAISCHSQIGIYTENPLNVFHIDPLRNTNLTGTAGFADDVVVDKNGQLGIGVINPTAKVDIRGTFRLRDGNQNNGQVLVTSNSNGTGKWGNRPRVEVIEVNNVPALLSGKTFTTTPQYTGISITIPDGGKWQIFFQVTCNASSNVIWDLCSSPSTYSLTDTNNRRAISSGLNPASVTGIYFVDSPTTTTPYLWCKTYGGTATYRAGGTMWALYMN